MKIPRPPEALPGEVNYAFFDRFSLAHFGIGVVYGLLGFSFALVVFLAWFWEVLENPLKVYLPNLFPHATADTLRNSVGDGLAVCTGWGMTFLYFTN